MIAVSACLLGVNCRWDGGNCENEAVKHFLIGHDYLMICPECLGGLATPRVPVELCHNKAIDRDGVDRSAEFQAGAKAAAWLCAANHVTLAVLKNGSPSCGVNRIHDGSFSGRSIPGMGMTAALLAAQGIRLMSEDDLDG